MKPLGRSFRHVTVQNKIDDGRGVVESVRMMADARLGNERDLPTEFFVAFGHDERVFVARHDIVGVTVHM